MNDKISDCRGHWHTLSHRLELVCLSIEVSESNSREDRKCKFCSAELFHILAFYSASEDFDLNNACVKCTKKNHILQQI